MSVSDRPVYEPNPKHKRPFAFGTRCPDELDLRTAQRLLEAAVANPGGGTGRIDRPTYGRLLRGKA